ncbi:hypothetical protein D7Z54_35555, partial [Salibacterium salarium]
IGGFTVYQYACRLVNSMAGVENADQQFFNETFMEYMVLVSVVLFISGGFFTLISIKKLWNRFVI